MKLQLLDALPEITCVAVVSKDGKVLYKSKVKSTGLTTETTSVLKNLSESYAFSELEITGKKSWIFLKKIRKSDILYVVCRTSLAAASLRLKCRLALA